MDNIYGKYSGGSLVGVYRNNGSSVPFQATDSELEDCCCGAENTCNDCDPPIPDTLYVTLSGLSGVYSGYNRTTEVKWKAPPEIKFGEFDCGWSDDSGYLYFFENSGQFHDWRIVISFDTGDKIWLRNGDNEHSCDPTYTSYYHYGACYGDEQSCEDSSEATGSVSETP